MANSNGIFKRGSSHYLRVVLPKTHQLINTYKSGKVIVSLGACSYREALTAGAIKRAQILEADEPIAKNSVPTSRPPSVYYLRDIYERWVKSKPRSSDAINTCMRALLLYEEHTENPPLHLLTRSQGDDFRSWLQQPERKTSSKTAYDRFTWVKTLLKFAYRDLELISRHPWEGIELFKETTKQRRPWSEVELQTLFSQDLFQKNILPRDWRSGNEALRKMIGVVPQDIVIFSDNAMENIRFGKMDATDEEVFAAASLAIADEFISKLPEGYQSFLGDRGIRLSGGQKQRIAIARVLLKNPALLLLDEATSALDAESELLVQRALEAAMDHRTTIVIAHRLSTVKQADKILVLENGRIIETGTHADLILRSGLYARLAKLQFTDQ